MKFFNKHYSFIDVLLDDIILFRKKKDTIKIAANFCNDIFLYIIMASSSEENLTEAWKYIACFLWTLHRYVNLIETRCWLIKSNHLRNDANMCALCLCWDSKYFALSWWHVVVKHDYPKISYAKVSFVSKNLTQSVAEPKGDNLEILVY